MFAVARAPREATMILSGRGGRLQRNDGHADQRDAGARDIPAGQRNAIHDTIKLLNDEAALGSSLGSVRRR